MHRLPHRLARSLFMALTAMLLLAPFAGLLPAVAIPTRAAQSSSPLVAYRDRGNVWLMDTNGKHRQQLTKDAKETNTSQSGSPAVIYPYYAWSHDGSYLLIVRDQTEDLGYAAPNDSRDLLLFDAGTGKTRTLVSHLQRNEYNPSWAQDADSILFMSDARDMGGYAGQATVSVSAVDLSGRVAKAFSFTKDQCGLPGGGPHDPTGQLYHAEVGEYWDEARPTFQWISTEDSVIVNAVCAPGTKATLVNRRSGEATALGTLADATRSSTGLLAGKYPSPQNKLVVTKPTYGSPDMQVADDADVWAWSPDGSALFYSTRTQVDKGAQGPLSGAPFDLMFYKTDLLRWDTSKRAVTRLIEFDAWAIGLPTATPDGKSVIFTLIENPDRLWQQVQAGNTSDPQGLIAKYGSHAKIQRLDLATGNVATIRSDADRPLVQPRAINQSASSPSPSPVTTTPAQSAATPSQATQANNSGPGLLAVLKDGKVWLMNADGSNARALPGQEQASSPTGPRYTSFSWSPSGRYLLVLRQDDTTTQSVLIYDPVSGQMKTLVDHRQGNTGMPAPAWTRDEDTVLVAFPTGTRFQLQLKKVQLDGSMTDFATYTNRDDCGGLDGPASPSDQQFMLVSRFSANDGYPSVEWSSQSSWLATNMTCHQSRIVDLSSGNESDPKLTPLTTSSRGLVAGRASAGDGLLPVSGETGIYDPARKATVATVNGVLPVWSPDGQTLYVLRTTTVDSAKVTNTDEGISYTLNINKVELWRVDANGDNQRRITSLGVYGAGLPTIASDGKTLVFATVQNLPNDLRDVPADGNVTSQWMKDHTPEIHLQRVDLPTGKVTRVAVGAYAPQLQPIGGSAATSGPNATSVSATTAEPTSQPSTSPTNGWIAYDGEDGNIWLIHPDGSDRQQVTTDGTVSNGSPTYTMPNWSHDGTMLAFNANGADQTKRGIMLLRDGKLSLLPNTATCSNPAFGADNQRVFYVCAMDHGANTPLPADYQTNPLHGYVSSSKLDGGAQRIEVPYTVDGSGATWQNDGKAMKYALRVDVRPSDGAILVVYTGFHKMGAFIFAADGTLQHEFTMPGAQNFGLGPMSARFTPDGQQILSTWCQTGCQPNAGNLPNDDVVTTDFDGKVITMWAFSAPGRYASGADMSPDQKRVIVSFGDPQGRYQLSLIGTPQVEGEKIGYGKEPAWQPVAAKIALPSGQGAPQSQPANTPTQQVPAAPPETPPAAATQQAIAPVGAATQATQPPGSASVAMATPVVPGAATAQAARGPLPVSGQLAYGAKTGGHWDVWVHDFGSGQNIQLTTDPNSDQWAPSYSHDGSLLAFLSDASGSNQAWVMNPDGSNQRQISNWSGDQIIGVSWSADDQTFYVTVQGNSAKRVMQMPVAGGDLTEFIPASSSAAVAVPGQNLLVYVTDNETTPQIAFAPADNPSAGNVMFAGDAPSVGGSVVACQIGDKGNRRIALHDLSGNGIASPPQNGDDSDPILTPDGSTLFYVVDNGGASQIVVWSPAVGRTATLQIASNDAAWYLAWRPNS